MNIGEKVVCVNDEFEAWVHAIYTELPKKGEIYTIRHIDAGVNVTSIESNPDSSLKFTGNTTITLLLEELHNDAMPISKKEMGFGAWRFATIAQLIKEMELTKAVSPDTMVPFEVPTTQEYEIAA